MSHMHQNRATTMFASCRVSKVLSAWAVSTGGTMRGVYIKPPLHSSLELVRFKCNPKLAEGVTESQDSAWDADKRCLN